MIFEISSAERSTPLANGLSANKLSRRPLAEYIPDEALQPASKEAPHVYAHGQILFCLHD